MQGHINAYLDPLSRTNLELKQIEAERPDTEDWPMEEEMAAYSKRIASTRDRATRAEQHYKNLTVQLGQAETEVRKARDELQALRTKRDQLKAQIEGRSYRGPFGLMVPAGGVTGWRVGFSFLPCAR